MQIAEAIRKGCTEVIIAIMMNQKLNQQPIRMMACGGVKGIRSIKEVTLINNLFNVMSELNGKLRGISQLLIMT